MKKITISLLLEGLLKAGMNWLVLLKLETLKTTRKNLASQKIRRKMISLGETSMRKLSNSCLGLPKVARNLRLLRLRNFGEVKSPILQERTVFTIKQMLGHVFLVKRHAQASV